MAEIKITGRTAKTFDPTGEAAKSALGGIGTGESGAIGNECSAFDARRKTGTDRLPSSRDSGITRREEALSGQRSGSTNSETSGGLNISFASGAVIVNDMQKSPDEIARDIVKPLSRELKKLGYLSS